ncbi:MAG: hypothetical protein KGM96_10895 [Acidobacteriota bacterium]|nr:hypothetical protein [Acidobacteriota bacterium]
MKQPILLAYQLAAGVSDSLTGAFLIVEPALTLRLLGLHVPADALPFLSFIGAFVFAVGLSYLYGATLVYRAGCASRLEAVWIVTAIVRCSVAAFILARVASGVLEPGWLTIAFFDGACVLIQAAGLRQGWLANVDR